MAGNTRVLPNAMEDMTVTPVTVGVASTEVIKANPKRRYLLIQNISNRIMYLNIGSHAIASQGIQLPRTDADGNSQGAIEFSAGQDNLTREAIYIVAVGGTGTVIVAEGHAKNEAAPSINPGVSSSSSSSSSPSSSSGSSESSSSPSSPSSESSSSESSSSLSSSSHSSDSSISSSSSSHSSDSSNSSSSSSHSISSSSSSSSSSHSSSSSSSLNSSSGSSESSSSHSVSSSSSSSSSQV